VENTRDSEVIADVEDFSAPILIAAESIPHLQKCRHYDLGRYGIIGVLLDSYDDVTAVLNRIERRYRANQIFVSGSAETYAPWKENDARQFLHELSARLAEKGFGIVSGFGVGVGPAVINGVLDQLERSRTQTLADRLVLRPFPQFTTGGKSLDQRWEEYRERIASEAGIAIFLFGNKLAGGKVVAADGVRREFEISVKRGLHVLPVGATGHVALQLWREVMSDFHRYYPQHATLRRPFRALGAARRWTDLIVSIVEIVDELRRRP
jgi:Sir2- and TIR-associating SLOG family